MKKMIIDCDPGIDDMFALILALKSPDIKVLGIIVASGNVPADVGAKNALRAIEMAGTYAPEVCVGSRVPLKAPYHSAEDTHGDDGIGNVNAPCPGAVSEKPGVAFILDTVAAYPGEVTICAVGPLTNLALCAQEDPAVFAKTKEIVLMGGTARFHGNCSAVAEFNFWCDPHAAEVVFKAGVPIVMVGLDVTHKFLLSPNIREAFKRWSTPLSKFLYDITQFYVDFHWNQERTVGCVVNDPLAVAFCVDKNVLVLYDAFVDIVTEGKAAGQSMTDFNLVWGKANAKVAMDADVRLGMGVMLKTLFPDKAADIDILLDFDLRGKRHGCEF